VSDSRPSFAEARRGLTLVELVVSGTLVVGIVGSACLCLISGRQAGDEAERRMGVVQAARVTLDRMARDLRVACRLDREFALIGTTREQDGVVLGNIDFATRNWRPRRPGEADRCEVSWFADRDPETGDLALFRRRDPTPDEEPLAGGYREQIVTGLRAFRLEYYDGATWHDEWGSANEDAEAFTNRTDDIGFEAGLPEAVRITLALAPPADPSARAVTRGAAPVSETRLFRTVVRLEYAELEREREFEIGGADPTSGNTSTESGTGATGAGAPGEERP
jgi:hypothetical protein